MAPGSSQIRFVSIAANSQKPINSLQLGTAGSHEWLPYSRNIPFGKLLANLSACYFARYLPPLVLAAGRRS